MSRKIVFFTLFLMLFTNMLHAQFKKGMRMVNATFSTIVYKTGNAIVSFPPPTQGYTRKETSFAANIIPMIGWFISDNTAIGISLDELDRRMKERIP